MTHTWVDTGDVGPYAGTRFVYFVRCSVCFRRGFRYRGSRVVYLIPIV